MHVHGICHMFVAHVASCSGMRRKCGALCLFQFKTSSCKRHVSWRGNLQSPNQLRTHSLQCAAALLYPTLPVAYAGICYCMWALHCRYQFGERYVAVVAIFVVDLLLHLLRFHTSHVTECTWKRPYVGNCSKFSAQQSLVCDRDLSNLSVWRTGRLCFVAGCLLCSRNLALRWIFSLEMPFRCSGSTKKRSPKRFALLEGVALHCVGFEWQGGCCVAQPCVAHPNKMLHLDRNCVVHWRIRRFIRRTR